MRREGRIPHKRYVVEKHTIPDGVTGEMVDTHFCTYRIETEGSNHSKCSQPHALICSGKADTPWNKAQCKIKGQKKWRGKYVEHACNDQVVTDSCDAASQKALGIAEDLDAEDCEADTWAPFDPASQSIPFTISESRPRRGCRRGHRSAPPEEEHVWLDRRHGLRGHHHHHHLHHGFGGHHHHGPKGPHFLHRHHNHGIAAVADLQHPAPIIAAPPGFDHIPANYWETIHPTEVEMEDQDAVQKNTLTENWNLPMEGWGRTDEPWDVLVASTGPATHNPTVPEEARSNASNTTLSDESAMTEDFALADFDEEASLESDWESVSRDDWESISGGEAS